MPPSCAMHAPRTREPPPPRPQATVTARGAAIDGAITRAPTTPSSSHLASCGRGRQPSPGARCACTRRPPGTRCGLHQQPHPTRGAHIHMRRYRDHTDALANAPKPFFVGPFPFQYENSGSVSVPWLLERGASAPTTVSRGVMWRSRTAHRPQATHWVNSSTQPSHCFIHGPPSSLGSFGGATPGSHHTDTVRASCLATRVPQPWGGGGASAVPGDLLQACPRGCGRGCGGGARTLRDGCHEVQRELGRREVLLGNQRHAEVVAVERHRLGRVLHPAHKSGGQGTRAPGSPRASTRIAQPPAETTPRVAPLDDGRRCARPPTGSWSGQA